MKPEPAAPVIELGLATSLRSALGDLGAAQLLREVTDDAGSLAADLALPVPAVRWSPAAAANARFEVFIGGRACRVPHEHGRVARPGDAPRELAARIGRVIHANREWLVDSDAADAIREARSAALSRLYLPGLTRQGFLDYLRLLIRGCFRTDRDDWSTDPARPTLPRWTAEACYAESVASIADSRCVLHRPPPVAAGVQDIDGASIEELFAGEQESLFYDLGVRIPNLQCREDPTLKDGEFRLQVNDVRLPRATGLGDRELLVAATTERLSDRLHVRSRAAVDPATGVPAAIVKGDSKLAAKIRAAGIAVWGRAGHAVRVCSGELRRHAAAYVTLQSVEHDLDWLRPWHGDVIASAQRRFGLSAIAAVLRCLAEEGIGVRDLVGVIEALLAVKPTAGLEFGKCIVFHPYTTILWPTAPATRLEDIAPADHAECVRHQFSRHLSNRYAAGQRTLIVYLLDAELESRLAASTAEPGANEAGAAIVRALGRQLGGAAPLGPTPVILTSLELRRRVRRLIEVEFPDVAVLSYQELAPRIEIQPIATIAFEPAGR